MICPACTSSLTIRQAFATCDGCGGAWISELELEQRVKAVVSDPEAVLLFEPAPNPSPGVRPCPTCRAALQTQRIAATDIDRCREKHGLWFDSEELGAVLMATAQGRGVIDSRPGSELSIFDLARPAPLMPNLIELIAWGICALLD